MTGCVCRYMLASSRPQGNWTLSFLYQTRTILRYYATDPPPFPSQAFENVTDRNIGIRRSAGFRTSDSRRTGESGPNRPERTNKHRSSIHASFGNDAPHHARMKRQDSPYELAKARRKLDSKHVHHDKHPAEGQHAAQRQQDARPVTYRRNERDADTEGDFVPFQTDVEEVDPIVPIEGSSTITISERKTFARLQALQQDAERKHAEKNLGTDGSIEQRFLNLDDVLNAAIASTKDQRAAAVSGSSARDSAHSSHTKISAEDSSSGSSKYEDQFGSVIREVVLRDKEEVELDRVRKLQYRHISQAMADTKTDKALWDILGHQVFKPIVALKLDEPQVKIETVVDDDSVLGSQDNESKTSKASKKTKKSGKEVPKKPILSDSREVVMHNFAPLVHLSAETLRTKFPTSPLDLCILPKLRDAGPSIWALGATTAVYNEAIIATMRKYLDIDSINDLLAEMEEEVIEHDDNTLSLVEEILKVRDRVDLDKYGPAVKMVWNMPKFQQSMETLQTWQVKIQDSVRQQNIRDANARAVQQGVRR